MHDLVHDWFLQTCRYHALMKSDLRFTWQGKVFCDNTTAGIVPPFFQSVLQLCKSLFFWQRIGRERTQGTQSKEVVSLCLCVLCVLLRLSSVVAAQAALGESAYSGVAATRLYAVSIHPSQFLLRGRAVAKNLLIDPQPFPTGDAPGRRPAFRWVCQVAPGITERLPRAFLHS
jgi:hypothetical protein